jgi:DNA-binding transcriptional MerR regulator
MTDNQEEFSIQFVSRVTGINPHTIRAWEKRYQVVVPNRDSKGRRLYNQSHIDRLVMLQDLVDIGNKISDLAKMSDEQLKKLCEQYTSNGRVLPNKKQNQEPIDVNETLQSLLLALQHYKLDILSHELEKAKGMMNLREFALSVLLPLLSEVGVQVQRKLLTIAQEYALTSILKFYIGQILYQKYVFRNKNNFNVLLVTPEGETHEFGILIAALLCSHYKINFYFLGANLPLESTTEAFDQIQPSVIISSVSRPVEDFNGTYIQDYVKTISSHIHGKAELWLGGVHKSTIKTPSNVKLFSSIRSLDQILKEIK